VGVDGQIDITDIIRVHMDKHKTNEFIVEPAGYYQRTRLAGS